MKAKGLDGRIYTLSLNSLSEGQYGKGSEPHKKARTILRAIRPYDMLAEEVFIPGCGFSLYMDFAIPTMEVFVEVQGEQHRKFNPFFHQTKQAFYEQRKRDSAKRTWADANGFTLITLDDDRTDEWERLITEKIYT